MALVDFLGIGTALAEATQTAATQTAPAHQGGGFLSMLPMLILFILVFYFLLVRPQTKRAKEQKKILSSIAVGDEVMTVGGLVGRVSRLKDNFVVMTVAKGVEITMQKGSVASVLPKGTMDTLD